MSAKVTQREIAQRVGVDRTLVSHALRGDPRVSEETRRQILEIAHSLGYGEHSNRAARHLIAQRYGRRIQNGSIAVLLPTQMYGRYARTLLLYMPVIDGIESACAQRGLDVVLCAPQEQRLPRLISRQEVDAVVTLASPLGMPQLRQLEVPVVSALCADPAVPALLPDAGAGARLATEHLISLGHRHIAYLGMTSTDMRHLAHLEGYREALEAVGLPIGRELIETGLASVGAEDGVSGLARLLERRRLFTAVVCSHDFLALGVILLAQQYKWHLPAHMSLVGFET